MSGRAEDADLVVWAPRADCVELITNTGQSELDAAGDGWFRTQRPPAGSDYQLSLDGGEPLPDPRSESQPGGPHGPSRIVDHDAFRWTDAARQGVALADLIIYELHIGTFTPEGTFDGATRRLGDLVDLGVTAIELLPVAEFPGDRGWL